MWKRIAIGVVGVLFIAWLAGTLVGPQPDRPTGQPVAQANSPQPPTPTTKLVPTTAPAVAMPTATPQRRAIPPLPAKIEAGSENPAYTITVADARRPAERRQRSAVELTTPDTYGRDEMVAVLRHAALWGLDVFPDANVVLVQAFALPRQTGWGWTGEAVVSRDGHGWSASDPDNGKIHITYQPLMGQSAKLDLDR